MTLLRSKILLFCCVTAACVASPGPVGLTADERLTAPSDPLAYYDRSGEGIRLFEENKFKESEQALLEATRQYPNDGLNWLYLGMAQASQRKNQEAIAAYQRAKELHTKVASWFVDYAMAQAYAGAGDKENAIKALQAVVAAFYPSPQSLYDKKMFAALRDDPRFRQLAGQVDVSGVSRNEGWRKDLDLLVEHIHETNPDYKNRDLPPVFLERYRRLRTDIPHLTDEQAYMGIVYMVASLNQGHTSIFAPPGSKLVSGILPIDFYAFPEGVFVIGADEKNEDLVGCELTRVEDTPAKEAVEKLNQYATVESRMELLTHTMLSLDSMAKLRGLGIVKTGKTEVDLTLRTPSGRSVRRTIGTVEPPRSWNNKLAPPPSVPAPLFLRNIKSEHWIERLPEHDAVYAQINHMLDMPGETLPEFGLKLRKALQDTGAKNLILDLRHNNGGTTQRYPELLRTVIAHTTKEGNRLYVLISRHVYSACANFVTDVERLGHATFVGEATSGFGNQHGDPTYFTLPYTGIACQLSGLNWQLGTPTDKRRSLVPDIPVQLTAKAYFAGQDPALDAVFRDLKRPARPPLPDMP